MYLERFLNYLKNERNFSFNTVKSYSNDLNQFFSFINKERKSFSSISSKDIRNWIVFIKEIGLEASTINRKISSLRTYFRFIKREGFILTNPIHRVNFLSVKKRLPVFLSEESMQDGFSKINFSASRLEQYPAFAIYLAILILVIFRIIDKILEN